MSHFRCRLLALTVAAALFAAGCSDDTDSNNAAANNGGHDIGQGTLEDAGTDADPGAGDEDDTGTSDTGADTSPEPDATAEPPVWLTSLAYLETDTGSGVSVNIINGRIGKIENSYERTELMTDEEIDVLEDDFLTEETRNKMLNGWDCGEATTDADGDVWVFEANTLVDADTRKYDEYTINVSGCVDPDSTEADAERVQEIIQHLGDLRGDHFQD